jgi:hypothetical protein
MVLDIGSNFVDNVFDFFNKIVQKWKILYIIIIPLSLLSALVMIPVAIIIYPLNYVYNKTHKTPKEFTFDT